MATQRYRVLYHTEIGGKFDGHFGHRQALVTATIDNSGYPVAANIATVLSNNSLHNPKPSALIVLDNVANLDPPAANTFI